MGHGAQADRAARVPYLHSTRGELLRRLGRTGEARDAFRRALALVHDGAERRLLERAGGAQEPHPP